MDALAEKSVWMTRKISSVYCEDAASAAVRSNRNDFLVYFLSGIQHQLNACRLSAALLVQELLIAFKNCDKPEVIDVLVESLITLRNNMRHLTALKSGSEWDSKFQQLDITAVVNSTKVLISTLAIRRRVNLKVVHEVQGLVDIDRFHFEQIIINLYRNAEQAVLSTPEMSGEISIVVHKVLDVDREQHPELTRRQYFCVTVRNGGRGIDPDTFARIGDLQFTTKPKGEGSGHGLQVCAYLMEKNGGFMIAKTHPEEGTAFTLFFPRV